MLEHTGIADPDGASIPARSLVAAALQDLGSGIQKNSDADLYIFRGSSPISEYNNPSLFPGMFPTLFPYGIGGFDVPQCDPPVSFWAQAEYLLELDDPSFRRHCSFMFIALNIHQCHQSHLHMAFSVRKEKFEQIAQELSILTPDLISSVAQHLESEGKFSDLSDPQKKVLILLKEVNTVSEKILGSSACKLTARNEIRAYMGYFGLPHIFMTINPNASHSPLFQLMYGDETVDLSERFPNLVNSREYAIHLASDPVAGAEFFSVLSLECIFQYLFGWDY